MDGKRDPNYYPLEYGLAVLAGARAHRTPAMDALGLLCGGMIQPEDGVRYQRQRQERQDEDRE